MRLARCALADVSIRTRDGFGRRYGFGCYVDLDEEISPSVTVSDALGSLVVHFDLVDPPEPPYDPPDRDV